jgi:hypothetical protein
MTVSSPHFSRFDMWSVSAVSPFKMERKTSEDHRFSVNSKRPQKKPYLKAEVPRKTTSLRCFVNDRRNIE